MSRLRAKCPDCKTFTAVALGPDYECHACGRVFHYGLVRVPQAWGDGGEAISYLAGEGRFADRVKFPEPLLVLLDLNMPRVNGFDVLRWMKRNGRAGFPLVLTLSYSQLESDVRLAYELGTSAFIAKPVDLDGSVSLVKLLINLERIAALRPRTLREPGATAGDHPA